MKRIGFIFCIIFAFIIGIPVMNSASDIMRAAEYTGEKIIDFDYFLPAHTGWYGSAYFITERHRVLYNNAISAVFNENEYLTFILDHTGKPIERVVNVSGSGALPDSTEKKASGIALRDDGKIYVWGNNTYGQFGNGTTSNEITTQAIMVDVGIPDIASVLSMPYTNYIITKNGDVYASGDNSHGQFGNGTTTSSTTFTKVGISNVKKLTGRKFNDMYALTNDGSVYAWGEFVSNGYQNLRDVTTPVQMYAENKTDFLADVVDIEARNFNPFTMDTINLQQPVVDILTYDNNEANVYEMRFNRAGETASLTKIASTLTVIEPHSLYGGRYQKEATGFVIDGVPYIESSGTYVEATDFTRYIPDDSPYRVKKAKKLSDISLLLLEDGRVSVYDGHVINIKVPLKIIGQKTSDNSEYKSEERYNGDVEINAIAQNDQVSCKVQNPLGDPETECSDFVDNKISITLGTDRIYRKYIFSSQGINNEFVVDLYKGKPTLKGFTSTSTNKIKVTDTISLEAPATQPWNSYTAKITDSAGTTKDYTGGNLAEGQYKLDVTDAYGNTQRYVFEVSDKPTPTADFTPSSTTLTYGDNPTKVNQTIGKFSLKYPAGEPTSTIKTIQLGTAGDENHFSIDTSGNLKVKGNDLDAGTYSVTVSGTDGNDMAFTKTVSITVDKKDQNNYQITNSANYPLQVNQEIAITTSGNESGGSETYSITNGNTVAQISNGNKFKILDSGTFTLEATVAGNTNYNSKTVTKQIIISQLPTQNPPVSITSKDSMMYGDTYTPSYSGGQGSGAISWKIESDNGTGAVLNNGSVKVTGIGSFTLKVTKAGTSSYQESSATKVITVNKRKTTVKPKDVTKVVGEAFKPNGATYHPQPVNGDNLGTLVITSKYPDNQVPGRYTDGIQASGLSNPNYEFEYQEGTLIVNSNALPNNGEGYYKVTGTKGKNNWYISDVQISTTNKNGYDEISKDGINFQTTALVYSSDGSYPTDFYLRNSSTGIISKAIRYQLKIDQTAPDVPTVTMKEVNKNIVARFINALSFGNWMNQAVQVTMTSTDGTSGLDYYEYTETSQNKPSTKTSANGIVTYKDDVELTVKAKACDKAGNCSELSNDESVMIDTKAPTISGVKDKSEYKQYYLPRFVNVKDNGSGLSYSEYKKDGVNEGTIQNNVDEKITGIGEYEVYAIDNAGNEITITFKIVSLPDIETEIDGSDESKEIIDQIIDELEEIKDKIDETEKKDIEDWIEDALEKWESLRKKVVETDDKSAKVEGQGDTDFDPSVVLIVDDITDQAEDIPPLPRKAINVYDVYLQKGNVRIQPDGSIKVYLPYTEASAKTRAVEETKPIVYEIDEQDKVKEINSKKEGNFVTFITDELLRYAISNDKQEINKDDMCVVGPDGKPNTGDEVCGLPSEDGKQPEKKPDGSVEVPDGGKVEFPNGTEIDTPDGAIIHPDGSVTLPDGTEYDPNGNKKPSKQCPLDGIEINIDSDGDGKPDVNIDIDGDCKADLNIDTDGDGQPNTNIDTDLDGKPDYNIDTDGDGKPDVNIGPINEPFKPTVCKTVNGLEYCSDPYKKPYLNIDSDGDGRPDINVDLDGDLEADINIDIDGDNIPDLDIDSDGDGKPDINIDTDHDGKADKNIIKLTEWKPDKNVDGSIKYDTMSNLMSLLNNGDKNNDSNSGNSLGGAVTGSNTGDSTQPFYWWIIVLINLFIMIYGIIKVKKEKEEKR